MALRYCLPYGLWIIHLWVVQEIPVKFAVRVEWILLNQVQSACGEGLSKEIRLQGFLFMYQHTCAI